MNVSGGAVFPVLLLEAGVRSTEADRSIQKDRQTTQRDKQQTNQAQTHKGKGSRGTYTI